MKIKVPGFGHDFFSETLIMRLVREISPPKDDRRKLNEARAVIEALNLDTLKKIKTEIQAGPTGNLLTIAVKGYSLARATHPVIMEIIILLCSKDMPVEEEALQLAANYPDLLSVLQMKKSELDNVEMQLGKKLQELATHQLAAERLQREIQELQNTYQEGLRTRAGVNELLSFSQVARGITGRTQTETPVTHEQNPAKKLKKTE